MKTNLKLSSKMHLFIIISCVVIAIGLAVGTACQFVANGFFNYSADYESYKNVTVEYETIDFSGNEQTPLQLVEAISEKAFADAGVASNLVTSGKTVTGGKVTYKFAYSTDMDKLEEASNAINAEIKSVVSSSGGIQFSYASQHKNDALLGGGLAISRAAIAAACVIAVHFIYFVIRYRLTMALGALLADVHNLALYIALTAACRIPVGSAVATYAVLAVIITVIGTSFLFDRMRKNAKAEKDKKLSVSDKTADECFMINLILPACLAAVSVVMFILLAISSLSLITIIPPVLCSLIAFVSCVYGTVFFVPSVYPRFEQIGINAKEASKAKKLAK